MSKSEGMIYEDGKEVGRYTVIPNDVLDKIADIDLTKEERKVLYRVIRDTIGYEKTKKIDRTSVRRLSHDIPVDRFVKKTGLKKEKIETALDSLGKRRIIKRQGDTITFNNNLDEWLTPKQAKETQSYTEKRELEQKEQAEQERTEWDSWVRGTP